MRDAALFVDPHITGGLFALPSYREGAAVALPVPVLPGHRAHDRGVYIHGLYGVGLDASIAEEGNQHVIGA